MGIFSKFAVTLIGNGFGLYLASLYVPGFRVDLTLDGFVAAAVVLTFINFFVKPILSLILAPIIFLTLGAASFGLNAFTLWTLDYLLPVVSISGFLPLVSATLIIVFINMATRLVSKIL